MGQVVIRDLDEALLADYRAAALLHGWSLEDELRAALGLVRPLRKADRAGRIGLSQRLRAMTPDAAARDDSTATIRRFRDTPVARSAT